MKVPNIEGLTLSTSPANESVVMVQDPSDNQLRVSLTDIRQLVPYIEDVNPDRIRTSTQDTIVITGHHFIPSTEIFVVNPGFDGTIDNVNIISPTEMEVTLTPGTQEVTYDLVLSNNGVTNRLWNSANNSARLEVRA